MIHDAKGHVTGLHGEHENEFAKVTGGVSGASAAAASPSTELPTSRRK